MQDGDQRAQLTVHRNLDDPQPTCKHIMVSQPIALALHVESKRQANCADRNGDAFAIKNHRHERVATVAPGGQRGPIRAQRGLRCWVGTTETQTRPSKGGAAGSWKTASPSGKGTPGKKTSFSLSLDSFG